MEESERIRLSQIVAEFDVRLEKVKVKKYSCYEDGLQWRGFIQGDKGGNVRGTEYLFYSTLFNWLMPVWIKFRNIQFEPKEPEYSKNIYWHSVAKEEIGRAILYGTIEEAFHKLAYQIEIFNKTR